jgi:hypothetical protein
MKNLKLFLVGSLVLMMCGGHVLAQTKEEKKQLKKELKVYRKMKPAQIRAMKINYDKQLDSFTETKNQLKVSNRRADSLQTELNAMNARVRMLEGELLVAQRDAANAKKGQAKGYYYRVQLGAYKNFDIKGKLNKGDETMMAENKDGMDKYVVGLFFNFEEADAFKNDIRKMGIRDAFVVPYKDGVRITHKEAKAGIEGTKRTGASIVAPEEPVYKKLEPEYQLDRAKDMPVKKRGNKNIVKAAPEPAAKPDAPLVTQEEIDHVNKTGVHPDRIKNSNQQKASFFSRQVC